MSDEEVRLPGVVRAVPPGQTFINTEVLSAVVLLGAALVALVWANSPWDEEYFELINEHIEIDAGFVHIDETVQHWINDGLMTLFFFVVGLEIKRELVRGELRGARRAALPVLAAIGGMVAPAVIYTAINAGGDGASGWGIPMATDIAFALGLMALLGPRIPGQLRIFLLALAIVDDIGAILVIAIFYTGDIQLDSLLVALGLLMVIFAMRHAGVRSLTAYFAVGVLVWLAVFESGVHATIAGVVLGLMTPAFADNRPSALVQPIQGLLANLREASAAGDVEAEEAALGEIEGLTEGAEAPLDRLERGLHPITSFLIVPLFAFANAGVSLDPDSLGESVTSSVALGVILGLVVGKPLGIFCATWVAVRMRVGSLPEGTTWAQILGMGMLAGVGFTVALFVNELAFDSQALLDQGKIGILTGSLLSAVAGVTVLIALSRRGEAAES
jgi:Na+:H+ antiporter, NhaA family